MNTSNKTVLHDDPEACSYYSVPSTSCGPMLPHSATSHQHVTLPIKSQPSLHPPIRLNGSRAVFPVLNGTVGCDNVIQQSQTVAMRQHESPVIGHVAFSQVLSLSDSEGARAAISRSKARPEGRSLKNRGLRVMLLVTEHKRVLQRKGYGEANMDG